MKQNRSEYKQNIILVIIIGFLITCFIFTKVIKIEGIMTGLRRSDFDCYVINLDKNENRLQKFTSNYVSSGLKNEPFVRIKAIYGKEINYKDYISDKVEIKMTPGMVGCFLSHLQLYDTILKCNKEYALVFEDDANIAKDLNLSMISSMFDSIPEDWDIILIGYDISNPIHKYEKFDGYLRMYNFWGTHAYFIKKTAAAKLLNLVKTPFTNQIDHVMGDLCKKGMLNVYGIPNCLVFQDSRYTDVQVM